MEPALTKIYDRYEVLFNSTDFTEFWFESNGPKGRINMVVQFLKTEIPDYFNLVFGNRLENGQVDELAINDNHDRDKVLSTVGTIINGFTLRYPHAYVIFMGSTPSRTRLYRMTISKHLEELRRCFDIYGISTDEKQFEVERYLKDQPYISFAVKRKKQ